MSNSIPGKLGRIPYLLRARGPLDMENMHRPRVAVFRYTALLIALFIVALLAIPVVNALVSDRGVAAPTLLSASSPWWGLTVLIVVVVLMTIVVCVVGRQVNAAVALFVLGCGLGVIAMRSGSVADFVWGDGSIWALGIETLVWSGVVALLALVVMRVSSGLPDVPHDWKSPPVGSIAAVCSRPSLISLICGLVALPIAWLLLADDLKGQALGAVVVGSFIAGMAGRLAAPKLDPILVFAGPVAAGGLAQLVIASGWSEMPALALVEGTLPRLAWVMPLDWAAGSLVGVSMGVGWARSFIREAEAHEHANAGVDAEASGAPKG